MFLLTDVATTINIFCLCLSWENFGISARKPSLKLLGCLMSSNYPAFIRRQSFHPHVSCVIIVEKVKQSDSISSLQKPKVMEEMLFHYVLHYPYWNLMVIQMYGMYLRNVFFFFWRDDLIIIFTFHLRLKLSIIGNSLMRKHLQ